MRNCLPLLFSVLLFAAPAAQSQGDIPPAAAKGATLPIGTKVYFEDKWNRYGGGMISGVIVRDGGAARCTRYAVKIDKPTEAAFQENYFDAEDLHPVGGGVAPAHQAQQRAQAQSPQQHPQAQQQPRAQAGGPQAAHAFNFGHPPEPGSFKYGHFNPRPMLGNNNITPPGLKPIFTGTPPGDETCVGRWYTQTGGVWTNKGGPDRNGVQLQEWGKPEAAEVILVQPDGTWMMRYLGKITTGKWYDIGQNVIRLVNMADGCDWTASVYDKMIEFKGQNGLMKQGNRY